MLLRWALWPRLGYEEGLALQQRLVAARCAGGADVVIATEHTPVVTLGPRAESADLVLPRAELERRGIAVCRTDRGGLATYHGPGQFVLYPIVALRGIGVRRYVALLEDAALAVIRATGLEGERRTGQPGVWVGAAKVASVGVRVQAGIASHGLAVNLTLDCTPFAWIRPCGMTGGSIASLAALGGRSLTLPEAARIAVATLATGLGAHAEEYEHGTLEPEDPRRQTSDDAHR